MIDLEKEALKKIAELEAQMKALGEEVEGWQVWIEKSRQLMQSAAVPEPDQAQAPRVRTRERLSNIANPTPSAIIRQEAEREIRRRQAPIPLGELTKFLEDKGLQIGGSNPAANLSAKLNQGNGFVSIRNEGWTMQDMVEESADENGEAEASPETADEGSETTSSGTLGDILGVRLRAN